MGKKLDNDTPGMLTPVTAGDVGIRVSAWRDTDRPRGRTRYHVVVAVRGQEERDFYGLTPQRIKALGLHLLELHSKLTNEPLGKAAAALRKRKV